MAPVDICCWIFSRFSAKPTDFHYLAALVALPLLLSICAAAVAIAAAFLYNAAAKLGLGITIRVGPHPPRDA
jgi:hypothetical protein